MATRRALGVAAAKIVPASAGDAQSVNVVQDRSANPDKEQIVSKQEEPVALKDLGTQAAPPVVLPAPVAPGQGASTRPSPTRSARRSFVRMHLT
jgi:hypothetical protein